MSHVDFKTFSRHLKRTSQSARLEYGEILREMRNNIFRTENIFFVSEVIQGDSGVNRVSECVHSPHIIWGGFFHVHCNEDDLLNKKHTNMTHDSIDVSFNKHRFI